MRSVPNSTLFRTLSSYTDGYFKAGNANRGPGQPQYSSKDAEFDDAGWGPASLHGVKGIPRPGGRSRRSAPDDQWRILELQNTISELPADFPHPAQLTAIVTAAAKQWSVPQSVGRAEVLLALAEKYMDKPCFTPPVVSALLHCMAQRGGPWAGRSHSAPLTHDERWVGLLDTITRTLKFAPEEWDMRCLATTLFSLQKILATHTSEEVRPLLAQAGPTLLRLLHAEGGSTAAGGGASRGMSEDGTASSNTVSLIQALYALARFRGGDAPNKRVFLAAAPALIRQLEGLTDQGLGMILHAYGRAGVKVPQLTQGVLTVLAPRVPGLDEHGVANLMWAMQHMQVTPDEDMRSRIADAAVHVVPTCSPQSLTHVASGAAALGVLTPPLLRALERRTCELLPTLRARPLSTLALALARAPGGSSAVPALLLGRVAADPRLCNQVEWGGLLIAQALCESPSRGVALQLLYKLQAQGVLRSAQSMVFLAGTMYAAARMGLPTATTSAPLSQLLLEGGGGKSKRGGGAHDVYSSSQSSLAADPGAGGSGGASNPIGGALPPEVQYAYQGLFDSHTGMDRHHRQHTAQSRRAAEAAVANADRDATTITVSGAELWGSLVQRMHEAVVGGAGGAVWSNTSNWARSPQDTHATSGASDEDEDIPAPGSLDWRMVHAPRVALAIAEARAARGGAHTGGAGVDPKVLFWEDELLTACAGAVLAMPQPPPATALALAYGLLRGGALEMEDSADGPAHRAFVQCVEWVRPHCSKNTTQLPDEFVPRWTGSSAVTAFVPVTGAPDPQADSAAAVAPAGTTAGSASPKDASEATSGAANADVRNEDTPASIEQAAAQFKARREDFAKWFVDGTWLLSSSVAAAAHVPWGGPAAVDLGRSMQAATKRAKQAAKQHHAKTKAAPKTPARDSPVRGDVQLVPWVGPTQLADQVLLGAIPSADHRQVLQEVMSKWQQMA